MMEMVVLRCSGGIWKSWCYWNGGDQRGGTDLEVEIFAEGGVFTDVGSTAVVVTGGIGGNADGVGSIWWRGWYCSGGVASGKNCGAVVG